MPKLNENYQNVKDSYLFAEIARRVKVYEETHPEKAADIIRLGIGDVTLPLTKSVIKALHEAVDSQAVSETFKGYGPDPVYPVYVDTNTMDGKNIIYMNGTKENDFLPMPDENVKADIIYLCSPNNPTGACYNKEQLEAWVAYALKNDAVILYDSAYEAFITDPTLPRSIYAIENAKKCAIEFCSLSKTAGFTGTRFSYTVVPEELVFETSNGGTLSLHNMWNRRQCTKFNGTPYIIQYAGAKVFTEEGMKECQENIGYYRENARMIAETLEKKGISFTGGVNSPYIWFECPKGMESWEFFDYLLENAQVVGTPGAGFGENGKNYFRLTSFGKHEKTKEAMERFNSLF